MAGPPHQLSRPGRIVVLNGAPRSGKSSVAAAMLAGFPGVWLNLGVDLAMAALPERLWPGIGLRPGGERPDLEPLLPALYAGLYEAVAAHSRLGLNVVVDVGHHEAHSRPLGILPDCARRLAGLPVLFVGLRCPVATILRGGDRGAAARRGRRPERLRAAGGTDRARSVRRSGRSAGAAAVDPRSPRRRQASWRLTPAAS
jgi:chloramphenicol 3-O phosphotransferase